VGRRQRRRNLIDRRSLTGRSEPPTHIRRLFRFSFVFLSRTGRTRRTCESSDDALDDDVLDAWLDEDEIDASGL
jgi:hypothetical protein